ncbi:uncharacterized protein [Aristolochia californica]|uniref:uncharacterized protein n=1 Tax=Aristolochia californica TaxID=171875 RepID=UPI0035DD0036
MAIAAATPFPVSFALLRRPNTRWALKRLAALASSPSPPPQRKLIIYSKPGCCLCDGLKEKLHAAFALGGSDSLKDIELQVRNILDNPEWERLYQYEIPVLARVLSDGAEETLPRLSPRLGVETIQKKLAAAFR